MQNSSARRINRTWLPEHASRWSAWSIRDGWWKLKPWLCDDRVRTIYRRPPMIDLYAAGTSNGMRARIAIEECGLAYTLHPVNLQKGEQKSAAFLAMNPHGQIPVIVDQDGPGGKPLTLSVQRDPGLLRGEGGQVPAARPGGAGRGAASDDERFDRCDARFRRAVRGDAIQGAAPADRGDVQGAHARLLQGVGRPARQAQVLRRRRGDDRRLLALRRLRARQGRCRSWSKACQTSAAGRARWARDRQSSARSSSDGEAWRISR